MITEEFEDERSEFRDALRRLLEKHAANDWARSPQTPAGGYDRQLWTLLTQQVEVAGLAIPESFGGSGFGYLECHLVLAELGRAVVASPFLASSVLATQALLLTAAGSATAGSAAEGSVGEGWAAEGSVAAAQLLPELAAGDRTAALVWDSDTSNRDSLVATRVGESWTVDGRARLVLDGARADLLLAVAKTRPNTHPNTAPSPAPNSPPEKQSDPGSALFLLDVTHSGLHREPLPTMDQSLHLAEVRCHAVRARRLGAVEAPVRSRLADLAATAITAEQVGGARRCLELTVEYVQHRVQFGRPIGSFQAIKHRLADLLVLIESADSASQAAAQAWTDDAPDASALASLAKSYCSQAYRAVTAEAIQLHGGIGFTWEHQAHRYFKRAHSTSTLFGDPSYHRRRLADHLGLTGQRGPT